MGSNMTDEEAKDLLRKLSEHYNCPVMPVNEYCANLREWAHLIDLRDNDAKQRDDFRQIELSISKSCLLNRTIYCGEKPSQTPCPVHEGRWTGLHCGWPGSTWSNGEEMEESPQLREWYDAGCRCYQHRCGCTTGWQPDIHCGCLTA
jgi:hypothetical protein